eukprot:702801-Prorocentrum_minimum.AAC.2
MPERTLKAAYRSLLDTVALCSPEALLLPYDPTGGGAQAEPWSPTAGAPGQGHKHLRATPTLRLRLALLRLRLVHALSTPVHVVGGTTLPSLHRNDMYTWGECMHEVKAELLRDRVVSRRPDGAGGPVASASRTTMGCEPWPSDFLHRHGAVKRDTNVGEHVEEAGGGAEGEPDGGAGV